MESVAGTQLQPDPDLSWRCRLGRQASSRPGRVLLGLDPLGGQGSLRAVSRAFAGLGAGFSQTDSSAWGPQRLQRGSQVHLCVSLKTATADAATASGLKDPMGFVVSPRS